MRLDKRVDWLDVHFVRVFAFRVLTADFARKLLLSLGDPFVGVKLCLILRHELVTSFQLGVHYCI